MKEYLDLVKLVLDKGTRKKSRTGVDTISYFGAHYKVDLSAGYPLLTTKEVNWSAMLRELLWYLSGEDHIRNLRQHTKIWDAWADADGKLETAYGRYWRRFPSPYLDAKGQWQVREVDQIQFVLDTLRKEPYSRRIVVTAWEPGNAETSKLPPCHYSFVFNVQGKRLNCHLTQRSGDIALGIPFNLACYATLTQMIAQEVGLEVGYFSHTIVDAHIYTASPKGGLAEYDHVPGLREQLMREPRPLPKLVIAKKPFDQLKFEDFKLVDYHPHPKIKFKVAV
ncbi:MAG TPA: thymidylate synthase [Verrucomicrobiae bacterium]|nr:thymidylate synthase [Verrucomicrobiae bacterium]